jgi:hypothetical protein
MKHDPEVPFALGFFRISLLACDILPLRPLPGAEEITAA